MGFFNDIIRTFYTSGVPYDCVYMLSILNFELWRKVLKINYGIYKSLSLWRKITVNPILIWVGKCLRITNILLVRGDIIPCVVSLINYTFKTIHVCLTSSWGCRIRDVWPTKSTTHETKKNSTDMYVHTIEIGSVIII